MVALGCAILLDNAGRCIVSGANARLVHVVMCHRLLDLTPFHIHV